MLVVWCLLFLVRSHRDEALPATWLVAKVSLFTKNSKDVGIRVLKFSLKYIDGSLLLCIQVLCKIKAGSDYSFHK